MPTIIGSFGFNVREMKFISKILNLDIKQADDETVVWNTLIENATVITNRISFQKTGNIKDINKTTLINLVRYECIALSCFDWIDIKNDRLCNYIWSYIRVLKTTWSFNGAQDILINKDDILNTNKYYTLGNNCIYETLSLESLPKDSKTKKQTTIEFFDLLDTSSEIKCNIVNALKIKWMRVSENNDVVRWATTNNQLWAWNYLYQSKNPLWFIENDNPNNYLDGLITTFDLLNDAEDKRALLLSKMKSAWSQKSYRDKNNGKKAVSIVLSEDIIKKLDFICENTDRRKNEVVTRLIREEHDKIKKGGH